MWLFLLQIKYVTKLKINKDVVCMEQRYNLGYQSGTEEQNDDLLLVV